jgi:hypothetical protein
MKNNLKYYVFILFLFALVATSCKKFIDILPENTLPAKSIDYSITADAYKPVAGMYSVFSTKVGGWTTLAYTIIRCPDVEKGNANPNDQQQLTQFHNIDYTNSPAYWMTNNVWVQAYTIIMDANLAMISLDLYKDAAKSQADKDLIEQYKAEVRVMRAYAYYVVYRQFGDVPLFTDNKSDKTLVKAKFQDVIAFIQTEMDDCYAILPKVHPKDMPHPGAVSAYTALALKAKASADILDYNAMLSATDLIISSGKFSLYPDFINLFNRLGRLCSENLFEIQFSNLGQTSGPRTTPDAFWDFQGISNPIHSKKKFNGVNLGGGWGFAVPTQSLLDFLTARNDTCRMRVTILKVGKVTYGGDTILFGSSPYPTMYNGKAYVPSTQIEDGRNGYGSGNNIRLIRYADILLLNAEAKVAKSQNGDVPLNLVRNRVFQPSLTNATAAQILAERHAELAMEWGEYYYDLCRTGNGTQIPNWTADKRFFPKPTAQIDLNPNLAK